MNGLSRRSNQALSGAKILPFKICKEAVPQDQRIFVQSQSPVKGVSDSFNGHVANVTGRHTRSVPVSAAGYTHQWKLGG